VECDAVEPGVRLVPLVATITRPGSSEKIAVMRHRLETGYHIHHPNDVSDRSALSRFLLWVEALAAVDRDVADRLNGVNFDPETDHENDADL
jgi:hypothetical protein